MTKVYPKVEKRRDERMALVLDAYHRLLQRDGVPPSTEAVARELGVSKWEARKPLIRACGLGLLENRKELGTTFGLRAGYRQFQPALAPTRSDEPNSEPPPISLTDGPTASDPTET